MTGDYSAPMSDTQRISVDSVYFEVEMPPGTQIHLSIGISRCVHEPTYRFPWRCRNAVEDGFEEHDQV